MGLSTGSGSSGIKKFVDLPGVGQWPLSAVPALPSGTLNTNYVPGSFTSGGTVTNGTSTTNVGLPTAAVGETVMVVFGSLYNYSWYTSNIENWIGWTFVWQFGSAQYSKTIPTGVSGAWNFWGSAVGVTTATSNAMGPAMPNGSVSAFNVNAYHVSYGSVWAYKVMDTAITGPSQTGAGGIQTNSTGLSYWTAVNLGVLGAPLSEEATPTRETSVGTSYFATTGGNANSHAYAMPPFRGLPYLHLQTFVNSSANVPLGGTTGTGNTQPERRIGNGSLTLIFRRVFGLDFNTSHITGSDASNYGYYANSVHFHAPHSGAFAETFRINGEVLLDRLELINSSNTERRAYAIISGPNVSFGSIGTQQSEVFGAAYLKDEPVAVYQTDHINTNSFRVLGVGRPVK